MKANWTPNAVGQLADIYEYIARDSQRYAARMVDRITARSRQLLKFPASGQVVPEYARPDIREVLEGPYRLIYRVDPDAVVVLAVIHGARQLPPEPPEDAGR
jgi:plasmid stabilization system protein ParE